jgi:putative transposase
VTELKIAGKKLYLSPDLDLYNGEIVAYQMAHYQKRLKEAGLK